VVAVSVLLIDRSTGGLGLGDDVRPIQNSQDDDPETTNPEELLSRVTCVAVGDIQREFGEVSLLKRRQCFFNCIFRGLCCRTAGG